MLWHVSEWNHIQLLRLHTEDLRVHVKERSTCARTMKKKETCGTEEGTLTKDKRPRISVIGATALNAFSSYSS